MSRPRKGARRVLRRAPFVMRRKIPRSSRLAAAGLRPAAGESPCVARPRVRRPFAQATLRSANRRGSRPATRRNAPTLEA